MEFNDAEHLTALVQTMFTPSDKIRLRRHAQQRHHTPSALVRAVVLDWMQTQEAGK